MAGTAAAARSGLGPFHVHPGHDFEGFRIESRDDGRTLLLALCACGELLDVADAAFAPCPDCCGGSGACGRCAGTGRVIDHGTIALQGHDPNSTVHYKNIRIKPLL